MAAFGFSFFGYEYERGLLTIQRTYDVASEALHDQKYECYAQMEALRRGEICDEYDSENGGGSKFDILDHEIEQIAGSTQLLRQSILIMLYHFWEKQVNYWAQKKFKKLKVGAEESHHHAYVQYCEHNDLDVKAEHLVALQYFVNLMKHGPDWEALKPSHSAVTNKNTKRVGPWETRLFAVKPCMFREKVESDNPLDWLELSHEHMLEFFTAVRESGPSASSTFHPKPLT